MPLDIGAVLMKALEMEHIVRERQDLPNKRKLEATGEAEKIYTDFPSGDGVPPDLSQAFQKHFGTSLEGFKGMLPKVKEARRNQFFQEMQKELNDIAQQEDQNRLYQGVLAKTDPELAQSFTVGSRQRALSRIQRLPSMFPDVAQDPDVVKFMQETLAGFAIPGLGEATGQPTGQSVR